MDEKISKKYEDQFEAIVRSIQKEKIDTPGLCAILHKMASVSIASILKIIPEKNHIGAIEVIIDLAEELYEDSKK